MSSAAVVSLDIHKKFSKAVVFGSDGTVLGEERVSHSVAGEMQDHPIRPLP